MKSVPLPELPWEAQLMFWILMLIVGVGIGVSIWFLIRYISGQDEINKTVNTKLDNVGRKFDDLKTTVAMNTNTLLKEVQDVQKSAFGVRQDTLNDITQIKSDLNYIKQQVK